jgi:hypothetical protein
VTPEDVFLLLLLAVLVAARTRKLVEAIVHEGAPPQRPPAAIPEGWTADRPAEQVPSANVIAREPDVEDARYVDLR